MLTQMAVSTCAFALVHVVGCHLSSDDFQISNVHHFYQSLIQQLEYDFCVMFAYQNGYQNKMATKMATARLVQLSNIFDVCFLKWPLK